MTTLVITSPASMPAASAGLPSLTELTSSPSTSAAKPSGLASSGVSGWTSRPKSPIVVLGDSALAASGSSDDSPLSWAKTTLSAGAGTIFVVCSLPSRK